MPRLILFNAVSIVLSCSDASIILNIVAEKKCAANVEQQQPQHQMVRAHNAQSTASNGATRVSHGASAQCLECNIKWCEHTTPGDANTVSNDVST